MNMEKIHEKIELAKKIVEKEENESIRAHAFGVILNKLLEDTDLEKSNNKDKKPAIDLENKLEKNIDKDTYINKKKEFSKNCGITIEVFDDFVNIKDDLIQLMVSIKGKDSTRQVIATKCILTIHELLYDKVWLDSKLLNKCIELSGINISHIARNLRVNAEDHIKIGGRGKGKTLEYKITGPGKTSTFEIIKKLIKGEQDED